ncbi:MAG: hypothetical protein L0Y71_15490 [Gemmataceae bacterium]|nr:hypothetical protein [Gemmataceae bacterium]
MALKHHVAFKVPIQDDVDRMIVEHFCGLGYRLVDEGEGEWHFHRGNKWSVVWRFDIRAYDTHVLVRANLQPDDATWVSCDFEVWTFMTLVFQGDIATLDAEARELESVLRHAVRSPRRTEEVADEAANPDAGIEDRQGQRTSSTEFRRIEDRIQ